MIHCWVASCGSVVLKMLLPDPDELGGEPAGDPDSDALFTLCEERGDDALPFLLDTLHTNKPALRESAVFMLQYFVDNDIIGPLLEALRREDSFTTRMESWVYVLTFMQLARKDEKSVLQTMLYIRAASQPMSYSWRVSGEFLTELLQN